MIIQFPNGMTVKELKDLVKDLPEVDTHTGDSFEVWITNSENKSLSNVVKEFANLNQTESGSDILLS